MAKNCVQEVQDFMQPTSPVPLLLAQRAPSEAVAFAEAPAVATAQRVEERPVSALAQGSYAWPAWGVVAVALVSSLGALWWWLELRRRKTPAPSLDMAAPRARGERS